MEDIEAAPFSLHPSRWEVTIFDLYSLAAQKNDHWRINPGIMEIFLRQVSLEVSVNASDYSTATKCLDTLKAMLYLQGMSPTLAPFATSYSLNEYAGINSRSSSHRREKLPEDLRDGITTKDSRVKGWPGELTFSVLRGERDHYNSELDSKSFTQAAEAVTTWQEIEKNYTKASILSAALTRAPLMPNHASSILHIWQALESVFGKGPELSFRMSLSLAELCWPVASRAEIYAEAKQSYKDRSEITHGKANLVGGKQWMRAWELLAHTIRAILHRKAIPSEDDLFSELLSR